MKEETENVADSETVSLHQLDKKRTNPGISLEHLQATWEKTGAQVNTEKHRRHTHRLGEIWAPCSSRPSVLSTCCLVPSSVLVSTYPSDTRHGVNIVVDKSPWLRGDPVTEDLSFALCVTLTKPLRVSGL